MKRSWVHLRTHTSGTCVLSWATVVSPSPFPCPSPAHGLTGGTDGTIAIVEAFIWTSASGPASSSKDIQVKFNKSFYRGRERERELADILRPSTGLVSFF